MERLRNDKSMNGFVICRKHCQNVWRKAGRKMMKKMFVLRFQSFFNFAAGSIQSVVEMEREEKEKSGFKSCVYHHVYIE
jgi:hypothetical protein